ncbi:MAG TPA: IS21 family transposase [Lentisphaeria bacterium]|nr:IS21 family transposase [Lentisphaeria bacterium]
MIGKEMQDKIKQLYEKDNKSMRDISKLMHCSRNTISKYLNGAESGYHRGKEINSPKSDFIRPIITQWLKEDESAPPKQKRTRKKIYQDLLVRYEFDGSYTTVKRVVREIKGLSREVFVPRHHLPGEYCEFDFGTIYIKIAGESVKINLHGFQLTYSNDIFGYLSVRAIQEEMFESHKKSFEHFDGIAQRIRYDNLSQAVKKVLKGSKRHETESFLRFRSRFGFESEFCAVGKGNQKGDVEGCIGYIRRNFFSPMPEITSLDELDSLNQELADWCISLRAKRKTYGTDKTVGEMYLIEKEELLYRPSNVREVGRYTTGKANHYSLVPVDKVFYSVPVKYAFHEIDVLVTAREVILYIKDKEIARHFRSWEEGKQVFDPLHYLDLFRKKPYALLNSKPIIALPEVFNKFFKQSLGKGYGNVSDCIEILKLLETHSVKDISLALELAMSYSTYYAEGVKNLLNQLVTDQPVFQEITTFRRTDLNDIKVPMVCLSRYDKIIPGSGGNG